MKKIYTELKESLREVIAYKKGKRTLKSELIEVFEPSTVYKIKDIKRKAK